LRRIRLHQVQIRFADAFGEGAYSVAVNGPEGEQTGVGGFPVDEHPLPVAMYVAPGRYGW
jgi:hypothetical protein